MRGVFEDGGVGAERRQRVFGILDELCEPRPRTGDAEEIDQGRFSMGGVLAEAAFGGEIEHLAADHAAEARGAGEPGHQRDPYGCVGMSLRPAQYVEGEGEEPVTGEDRGGLVEFLVRGWAAAAKIVIVH